MKKKKIIVAASMIATVVLIAAGILTWRLLSREKLTVEVNTEFDLTTLDGYTDYSKLQITYDKEAVPVDAEKIVFDKLGVYKVTGGGVRYEITVEDTTAPVVHLMGSLMKLQATDEVELPEVRVVDNYDENIKDYTLNVYSGETEVPVENQAFYVQDSGDYVIRMSAKDSSGNQGKNEKLIHVTPLFDKKVKVGEVVEIRSSWITYLLPEGSNLEDYDFSYRIYRNGTLMDTEDNKFTAEGNCYYNVCITADSKKNEGESYSGWIIFVEEHARMLTFTTMTTDEVGNAGYNLICNPYEQIERTVKDFGDGRFTMHLDVNVKEFPAKEDTIMLAWPVDAWVLPKNITDYDASFSLTLKGKLKDNAKTAEFVAGGYDNRVQNIRVEGADGAFECTEQISTEKVAAFTEGGVTRIYYILTVPKDKLAELEIDVDNFQLTPKAPPVYTGEEYLAKEMGERVELTEADLGLAATDCLGGTVKSIEITGVKRFDENVQGKRREFKGEALTEKGIYFIACHITDYYGNEADAEMIVSIGMGVLDVKAPKITSDQKEYVVSPGTAITLGEEGIPDYLTIEDESSYKVSYQVYRNGKEVKADSFTVGEYDRYEVYVTAVDSSILENEGKGYMMFLGSGLRGAIATVNTDEYTTINYGGESHLMQNGVHKGFFYPFDAKIEEESGNPYVKLTPNKVEYGRLEIMFPANQNERGIVANFDFKVGGQLSGRLSNSEVLFEIGGETVTVADVKAGKRFTVSASNLYNRLPDEGGLRTQVVYFENCENFLKEKGLYLCVDNLQADKVFEDLYSETNSFNTVALNKNGIILNNSETALALSDSQKYELSYKVYRNGTESVNTSKLTRSGYEYYEVEVSVLYRSSGQMRTQFKMTFQWDTDCFITMENGEKFYRVEASNGNPAYDQLLDSRETVQMEMFPFLGELKKDGKNTYLSLTPSVLHDGATLAIININDASEHKANVGFTFWIEGDVSGLPGDTLLAMVGTTEIRAKDIGAKFSYENKITFNGFFSEPIYVRNYEVLYQRGLKLCIDNVWRKKIVEEQLFQSKYQVVNQCDHLTVSGQNIVTDKGTVLQLSDSRAYELVCEVYKNGVEKVTTTDVRRQGNDFYSVNVSVRNRSTGKIHGRFELIFAGATDDFRTMEESEGFWRIPSSDNSPAYDQFLDGKGSVRMEFFPFTGNLKTVDGNSYVTLKTDNWREGAAISIINIEDASEHKADVGFNFWIEGDVLGADPEAVVAVIGGQTVRVKDIGRKFYYQNQLNFNGCYGAGILVEQGELMRDMGLQLCIDNAWRAKRFNNAYTTVNVCDQFTLNEKEILMDGTNVALQLSDSGSYELSYEVYKNGVDRITVTNIKREATDFYSVNVTVKEKTTRRLHSQFNMIFAGAVDRFIAMENGEHFNRIEATDTKPAYDQLLDAREAFLMNFYPLVGERKSAGGNTYLSLQASDKTAEAAISLVNIEDASRHIERVGFTFWIEGNAAGLPEDAIVAELGGQTVRVRDLGRKFCYNDRLIFDGCFAENIVLKNDAVFKEHGMRLCLDNIWQVKLFEQVYTMVNVCDTFVLSESGIVTNGAGTALALSDSRRYELVYDVYKNGVEKTADVEVERKEDDFYSVNVSVRNKATGKVFDRFNMVFAGTMNCFASMEDREHINEIAASGQTPAYAQLLSGNDTFEMELYPFTGAMKTSQGNTYMSLKVNAETGAVLSFVNVANPAEHKEDVGFTFWVEGDAAGVAEEDVVLAIGGQTIKGKDIGRKYAYRNQLTFFNSYSEGIAVESIAVLKEKGLQLCIDNTWRRNAKEPEEPEKPENHAVDAKLIDGNPDGFFIETTPEDLLAGDDTWMQRPTRVEGGIYVEGKLKEGCVLIKLSDRYYIALSDGGVKASEGTTVVLEGIYGRCGSDPQYGDDYKVKFNRATFRYTNGAWQEIAN